MLMAAGQRKRRLSGNNVDGRNSHELHRGKKKSLASLQFGSLMKPHISLELDGSQMQVVAKREQIGLSRRDLAPFSRCVSYHQKTLADVITLPKEMFALKNLENVFSYEIWRECFSKDERLILSQFLPKGVDVEEVVQSLFEGSNISFGNPLLKWSNMLASGDLHPDAIIQRDCSLFANQKAYCSMLQEYHIGMLRNLLRLKEMWNGCQDPVEFFPNISRTRHHDHTVNSTVASPCEYKLYPNRSLGETSESISTMEHDQECSSDNHTVIVGKIEELQRRKGPMLDNTKINTLLKDVVRHGKGESRNCNVLDDGAKYMACVRITKKQFELLKSTNQPGKCIQSKSVKHVLGNLSSYCVQPFATFEEKERKKIHRQWLLVVNTVAQASAEWRVRHAHKEQIAHLLSQEIKQNAKKVLQDEESTGCNLTDVKRSSPADPELNMEDYENISSFAAGVQVKLQQNTVGGGFESNDVDSVEFDGSETTDLIPNSQEDCVLDMASENDVYSNGIDVSYVHGPTDFPCTSSLSFCTLPRDAQSGAPGIWQTVKPSCPPLQSMLAGEYTNVESKVPCRDLDLQSNLDRHPQFLNSGIELRENGTESVMPYRLNNQQTFSTFPNEDRSGVPLQSIFSNPRISPYTPYEKQLATQIQQAQNVLMGNPRLPVQYQESPHQTRPMETRLKIDEQLYMDQLMSDNMHDLSTSNNGSSFPAPEHLPPFQLQDWHANLIRMASSTPLQTQSHTGNYSTQNWYSPAQQIHGEWSNTPNALPIVTQSIRHETSNNDESLYSILSQCKELRSPSYNHHMDSIRHDIALGPYGVTGGNTPRISNGVPHMVPSLEFFNGTDLTSSLPTNSISWVNIPQQSWNQ